jgi:predicted aspartyl protease
MKRRVDVLNTSIRILIPLTLAVMVLLPCVPTTQAQMSDETAAPSDVQLTVMSKELLDGIQVGANASSLNVHGDIRALEDSNGEGVYQELFSVNTGAADSIAPASELEKIGVVPAGQTMYTLPDGTVAEYSFGLARIEFMGEMKEGRIIFGPEDVKPTLGVSALESIGFTVDPETQTLKRLSPAE